MNDLPLTCLDCSNTDHLWALWKLSHKSVNQALLSKRQFQDKFRLENFTWRLWYRHQQQKPVTVQKQQPVISKFYLDEEEEEEEEEDYYYASSSNNSVSSSEDEEEDELVFEKKSYQISTSSSLLIQMLKPETTDCDQTTTLKRCQSRYQYLNEWFNTAANQLTSSKE